MPPRRTSPKGYEKARCLRRIPTEAEKILWTHLRAHRFFGIGFRRQHAIGPYVVDFCSPRNKMVIELDGGQHSFQAGYDNARTEYLREKGYSVLRFWNNEVMTNLDGVLYVIAEMITPSHPSPNPRK
jgi:very-short-patch-repair endonuclease